MGMLRGKGRGIAFGLCAAFLYALMPILVQGAYACGVGVLEVILIRMLGATLCFAVPAYRCFLSGSLAPMQYVRLFVASTFYALSIFSLYFSLREIDAGLSSLIYSMFPLLVVLVALVRRRIRFTVRLCLALLAATAGVFFLFGVATELRFTSRGLALSILGTAFFAAYVIVLEEDESKSSRLPPALVTFSICSVTLVACLAAFCIRGVGENSLQMTNAGLIFALACSLLCTGLPMFLFVQSVRFLGTVTASIVSELEPAMTMGVNAIARESVPGFYGVIGCVLIVLSGVLSLMIPTDGCGRRRYGRDEKGD